jgi:hypothetical protein
MKLTRTIVLGIAFLMPSTALLARAEDKPAADKAPAAETAPPDGEKKAKKTKKAKKEEKKEEAPAAPAAAPAK